MSDLDKIPETHSRFLPITLWRNTVSYKNHMIDTFGLSTLVILFLVYWSQGFRQFGSLAITFYYKDVLNLSPAATQYIRTFTYISWFIKPVYGLISDNIPILGYRRKAYILSAGIIGVISTLSIVLIEDVVLSMIALILSEFSQAVCDVIADAIMVEEARKDPEGGSGALQSYCWFVLSVGGVVGSPLGGIMLDYIRPQLVIAIMGICPMLLVVVATILKEEKTNLGVSCNTIKLRLTALWNAAKEPTIHRSLIFLYLSSMISPSYPELMVYYMKDELNFTTTFLSIINTTGFIALALGSLCYSSFFKLWNFRSIVALGQILMTLVSLLDLALVTRFNLTLNIPDTVFALGGDSVQNMVGFAFKGMPIMVLSAKLCPEGIEATLFALFTSVMNLSSASSVFFGGVLTEALGVSADDYSLMWVLMLVRSLTKLIPLVFINLLPSRVVQPTDEFIELESFEERSETL